MVYHSNYLSPQPIMIRRTPVKLGGPTISKATRLQLGNIKTDYGNVSTAAGSAEKWGHIYRATNYPILNYIFMGTFIGMFQFIWGSYMQYRDMLILSEHITYEDVMDRCLTPVPGWARLKSIRGATPTGPHIWHDPTPLDWLPFELKLGAVKQASY